MIWQVLVVEWNMWRVFVSIAGESLDTLPCSVEEKEPENAKKGKWLHFLCSLLTITKYMY